MDQHDMQFVPHLLVVQTGTEITFPNGDDVSHHVYSFSEAKPFELKLYKGDVYPPRDVRPARRRRARLQHSRRHARLRRRRRHAAFREDRRAWCRAHRRRPERRLRRRGWTPRARPGLCPPTQQSRSATGTVAAEIRINGPARRRHTSTRCRASHGNATDDELGRAAALAATWAAAAACAQSDRSDRNEFYFDASAGYVSADTDLNTWTEGGFSKLRYSRRRLRGVSPVRRIPWPHQPDAARARRRRLRRRRLGRHRLHGGRHRLAADPALAQSAASALRRVLSVILAREHRPRLAEPVHVFVLGDQHVDRRGDSAVRRRMVVAPPLRRLPQQPRAARIRGRVLRQRPGGNDAVLARLVAARPPVALQ